MNKPHCDNCDAVIAGVGAHPTRMVTVDPLGFQCVVVVMIRKDGRECELCATCLHNAAKAFAESIP